MQMQVPRANPLCHWLGTRQKISNLSQHQLRRISPQITLQIKVSTDEGRPYSTTMLRPWRHQAWKTWWIRFLKNEKKKARAITKSNTLEISFCIYALVKIYRATNYFCSYYRVKWPSFHECGWLTICIIRYMHTEYGMKIKIHRPVFNLFLLSIFYTISLACLLEFLEIFQYKNLSPQHNIGFIQREQIASSEIRSHALA